jgi:hypothetical protein
MPATWSTYQNAMKEVWTTDNIVSQLGVDNELFDRVEKTAKFTVGEYAIVPDQDVARRRFHRCAEHRLQRPERCRQRRDRPAAVLADLPVPAGQDRARRDRVDRWQGVGRRQRDRHRDGERRRGAQDADLASALRQRRLPDRSVRHVLDVEHCRPRPPRGDGQDALLRQWLHPGLVVDIGTTASEAPSPPTRSSISRSRSRRPRRR